jgi:hypothetical protein
MVVRPIHVDQVTKGKGRTRMRGSYQVTAGVGVGEGGDAGDLELPRRSSVGLLSSSRPPSASASRKGDIILEELLSSSRPRPSLRRRPVRSNRRRRRRCREREKDGSHVSLAFSGCNPRVQSSVSKTRLNRGISGKTGRVKKPP